MVTLNINGRDTQVDADSDAAMSGNICRCGTYQRIHVAIKDAAKRLPDE